MRNKYNIFLHILFIFAPIVHYQRVNTNIDFFNCKHEDVKLKENQNPRDLQFSYQSGSTHIRILRYFRLSFLARANHTIYDLFFLLLLEKKGWNWMSWFVKITFLFEQISWARKPWIITIDWGGNFNKNSFWATCNYEKKPGCNLFFCFSRGFYVHSLSMVLLITFHSPFLIFIIAECGMKRM